MNTFKSSIMKHYGKEQGNMLYSSFHLKYQHLLLNRSVYGNKSLNKHLVNNILPGIALFDALRDTGHSENEALDSMGQYYQFIYQKTVQIYKVVGRIPFFFLLLRKLTIINMTVTYPKEGWTTQWLENNKQQIAFDVTSCFYQTILKQYGHEMLLQCFCQIDDALYEGISPRVRWHRTTTLGRCGSKCDFRFYKV